MQRHIMRRMRRGLTLPEVVLVLALLLLLASMMAVAGQDAIDRNKVTVSLTNLKNFGVAHATYSSEWNGRMCTTAPDDLSKLIGADGAFPEEYPNDGPLAVVPSVPLGFDINGTLWSTRKSWAVQPMWYPTNCSLGSFRGFNTKPFAMYLNNKVYDPIFWAPKDYTMPRELEKYFDNPGEWPGEGTPYYFPTYCSSVSAMMSPRVFAGKAAGGFVDPRSIEQGFRMPSYGQAMYPDLKTHMLEHYWLQNPPAKEMPGAAGAPYFFNLGAESNPATLFFDGHVRMMKVQEALDANARVTVQGEDPLWVDEGLCFQGGYFSSWAVDAQKTTSYHLFTRDGIKGRDTMAEPQPTGRDR